MKKIISVLLLVALLAIALVGCGNKDNGGKEESFSLSIAVNSSFSGVKTSNTAVALVTDAAGKIVACRLDCAESEFTLADGELATNPSVTTKVELGDDYKFTMSASWAEQAKAFESYVVGKTAAEVAALDVSADGLVAGCTMKSSMADFKAVIAKAFAYERKVSFKTNKEITLGLAIAQSLSGAIADESAAVAADYAASVLVDGKVAAAIIDSNERTFTISYNADDEAIEATEAEYAGTKNEQGDAYGEMPAGYWYEQAQAFANTALGKTAAEVASLTTDKDALTEVGCTIYAGGYKAVLVKAVGYAR